tara:strand:+ start:152 stop:817 length:666 start_codon:yes stop_codon:yes gene_type:complete
MLIAISSAAALLSACGSAPQLTTAPMPESGFLPDYSVLVPAPSPSDDVRIWRYRKSGVDADRYTAVILDPVYLNQDVTEKATIEAIASAKAALQASMTDAVNSKKGVRLTDQPGPNVARISVAITGAESSADSLKPWNFTPVGLAMNAAAYAGDMNSKTPAMLVESKLTDSQTDELIGEGLVTVQGDSFRTSAGSVDSYIAMAKKVVQAALAASASPEPMK